MNFFKLDNIDSSEILKEVQQNNYLWKFNTNRQNNIKVQSETQSIILRNAIFNSSVDNRHIHESRDTNLYPLFPKIKKFINAFIDKYEGEIGRILIVKLPLEKMVYPHTDAGDYYKIRDRFHYVIEGMYEYTVNNELKIFKQNELWYFNNKEIHFTKTIGNIDRIALIFDVKDSKWREFHG